MLGRGRDRRDQQAGAKPGLSRHPAQRRRAGSPSPRVRAWCAVLSVSHRAGESYPIREQTHWQDMHAAPVWLVQTFAHGKWARTVSVAPAFGSDAV